MSMPDIITINHSSGSYCEVSQYGATVLSFYTAAEPTRNALFVSDKAALDGSKPIRGGIPLVFPVFGPAAGFPNHGFARTSTEWELKEINMHVGEGEDPSSAQFSLEANDVTRALWPHAFELVLELKLYANKLTTALHVHNKSDGEISFQALLHTYLSVDDVRDGGCQVEGLQGLEYHDKVTGTKQIEQRSAVTFDKETDSVYANAPTEVVVRLRGAQGGADRVVTIAKNAFLDQSTQPVEQKSDAVVWNPWTEKAKGMSDFGDDEYLRMVCVEPGRVSEFQQLAPGHVFTLQQTIHVAKL